MSLILVSNETSRDNALLHYRTPGSKNGIRRYQYPDGSLTPEGRQHYGVGDPRKKGSENKAAKESEPGEKKTGEKDRIGKFIDKRKAKVEARRERNKSLTRAEQKAADKQTEERVKGFISKINNREWRNKEGKEKKPSTMDAIREARNMSDEDLNKQLDRLRREKQYAELVRDRETREKGPIRAAAEKLVGDAVQDLAKKSLTAAIDTIVAKGKEKLTSKSFKLSDYKDVDIYSMDSDKVEAISKAFNAAANLSRNRWAIEHPGGNDQNGNDQGNDNQGGGKNKGNQNGGQNQGGGNKGQTNGSQNGQPGQNGGVITKAQRKQMRAMANSGKSAAEIAKQFGVSESTVQQYAGEQLKSNAPKDNSSSEPTKAPRHSYDSGSVGQIMGSARDARSERSRPSQGVSKSIDRGKSSDRKRPKRR